VALCAVTAEVTPSQTCCMKLSLYLLYTECHLVCSIYRKSRVCYVQNDSIYRCCAIVLLFQNCVL